MQALRRSEERGHADHGWLRAKHTFSFSDYYDPEFMGFRSLRVINEDRVAAGKGFATHGHKDMEILTYVIKGSLEHKDSMGNGSVIRPGEVQYMSAGSGVRHSEFNPDDSQELHLLQIWILPNVVGAEPRYGQKDFSKERSNRLCLMASPDGAESSIAIRQNAKLYGSVLQAGKSVEHRTSTDRGLWIQVVTGVLEVAGQTLKAGDALKLEGQSRVEILSKLDSELLLFDLE